jgi:soluble lytic murein transglycosylase-like protein
VSSAIDRYGIERDLAESIYDKASEAGIEPKLAFGLVKTESSFKQRAVSHVGARGFTQVMPRTAKWLRPGTRADDLYDRDINLGLGFRYLNQLIDKYSGDVKLALLAYNRGPGTVDKILKRGGDPDNGYARKVIDG